MICNDMLKNYDMSLATTGFLGRVLALPKDWSFSKAWARKTFKVGEQKLERILAEAVKFGFSKFVRERNPDMRMSNRRTDRRRRSFRNRVPA